MKLKMKLMAAAVALAASAGAHAYIDSGNPSGNGDLVFSIWDANTSFTFDTNYRMNDFFADFEAPGLFSKSFTLAGEDLTRFNSFMTNASGWIHWNLVANDSIGARRMIMTYQALPILKVMPDGQARTVAGNINNYFIQVNTNMATPTDNSVYITSNASTAWAGVEQFGGWLIREQLRFDNKATLANNSYETGIGMLRIDAQALLDRPSVNTPFMEGNVPVRAWLSGNTIHIAAVPEAESYAMMLAGLGLLGFMARRRLSHRV